MTYASPDELMILSHALQAAEHNRRGFLAEQFTFPQRIRQAIQLGDREQVINLQQRQNELPQHIATVRVSVLQIQIRRLEIEHRVVAKTQRQLQREVVETWEAFQAARVGHPSRQLRQVLAGNPIMIVIEPVDVVAR